ncbi:DUF4862 family protein [Microbacterium invictum]|uniref:DUF4862 domain-containing protein n=1 Tax=Microbacterium invictum TaxID=515415 RepID=A0AA40VP04_9MICO|nr:MULTISPECIES: DUF4862 family protein [Microbacterium]MBB4141349.1 hypothetical protein [Microbacterium invictum]
MATALAPVLISAYAASPAHTDWDPALEHELLDALCALPGVAGLEVPWLNALHPHDTEWFLTHVPAGARLALTALPWAMQQCARTSGYGIASGDEDGRRAALDDLRALAAGIHRLHGESPAHVDIVPLHTAPQGTGCAAALARSLDELTGWDWQGARLVIEHCDAVVPGQAFEKGFLSIGDELAAIDAVGASVGVWVNWGRSAIELRDADAVTAQIAQASASGLLTGLTFSGASPADTTYGAAWEDRHLPVAAADPSAQSLLDDAHIAAALREAAGADWLGIKVSRAPADRTAAQVAATVAANLSAVRRVAERTDA